MNAEALMKLMSDLDWGVHDSMGPLRATVSGSGSGQAILQTFCMLCIGVKRTAHVFVSKVIMPQLTRT